MVGSTRTLLRRAPVPIIDGVCDSAKTTETEILLSSSYWGEIRWTIFAADTSPKGRNLPSLHCSHTATVAESEVLCDVAGWLTASCCVEFD